jgi:hypothetical protein
MALSGIRLSVRAEALCLKRKAGPYKHVYACKITDSVTRFLRGTIPRDTPYQAYGNATSTLVSES